MFVTKCHGAFSLHGFDGVEEKIMPSTSHNTTKQSANTYYSNYQSRHGFRLRQFSVAYSCTLHASWFMCFSGLFPVLCICTVVRRSTLLAVCYELNRLCASRCHSSCDICFTTKPGKQFQCVSMIAVDLFCLSQNAQHIQYLLSAFRKLGRQLKDG